MTSQGSPSARFQRALATENPMLAWAAAAELPPLSLEDALALVLVLRVTDPDSRLLKAPSGYVQGDNAQAAVNEAQIVIAAEVTVDSPDFGHLEPMVDATQNELEQLGVKDTPDVVAADAGYWHQQQMEKIVNRGIQVLIPPDSKKRKDTRPGWDHGLYAFMRRVLATELGGELYRKRQALAAPVSQTRSSTGGSTASEDAGDRRCARNGAGGRAGSRGARAQPARGAPGWFLRPGGGSIGRRGDAPPPSDLRFRGPG